MIPRPLDVDITEAVRFGEGLFWSARMADFTGWGTWFADSAATPSEVRALSLYAEGWRVISRKHRLIARLPPGETGRQSYQRASGARSVRQNDADAGDLYRSLFARREGFEDTVTMPVIVALARHTSDVLVANLPPRKKARRA